MKILGHLVIQKSKNLQVSSLFVAGWVCGVLIGPCFSCPVIYGDIDLLVQIMRGADWPPLFLPSDIP